MSNLRPLVLPPRSAAYYAFTRTPFVPIQILGDGKSATAYLARRGPLVRVFRVTHPVAISMTPEDSERYYRNMLRNTRRSHEIMKSALRMRTPRIVDVFVVRNTPRKNQNRGRAIGMCTVMEFVTGPSLSDHVDDMSLSQIDDLKRLFRMMWSRAVSHGDAIPANIIYDTAHRRYTFIDIDSTQQHRTVAEAKERDLGMLIASMPPKLVRELRTVAL